MKCTFTCYKVSNESKNYLIKLCNKYELNFLETGFDDNGFHCTTFFSYDTPNDENFSEEYKVNTVVSRIEGIDLFGDENDILVLKLYFPSGEMKNRNDKIRFNNCKPTFEKYTPHLTLTYRYDRSDREGIFIDFLSNIKGKLITFDYIIERVKNK